MFIKKALARLACRIAAALVWHVIITAALEPINLARFIVLFTTH